ncbi:peptidoglycan-binding protein [Paracoccus sp. pheM1]|uniref:peptidoglycan-binding domain-containing protein n=1 Tax=Paracoccus sp. pheM1 TaxID=2831675 RepID=UPI001BDB76A8|nr:peptidoglycan-binding protein [Paracoccus sp. pheM1]MBT0780302.1 peptidoglycan-binding protein [Paracoccus sp. pheM1]
MRIAAVLLAALVGAVPAWAENRAVIIGNADYRSAPDLAGSDTMALAKALREAGFTTQQGVDLEARPLRRLLEALARADADPGAHIVALNGRFLHDADETWFMGTDADAPGPAAAGVQGVPLSLVMRLMAGGEPGSVLILGTDAQQMPHRPGLENGIGALRPPAGVSVVTGPPEAGARALAGLLGGATLAQATAGRALALLPEDAGNLRPVPSRNTADALADDRDAWAEAAVADGAPAYRDYLARYPQGIYAADARQRLAQIGRAPGVRYADRAAWSQAVAADTAAAYATYLKEFPVGRHAGAARKRLTELRPAPPARPASQPSPAVAAEQVLSLGPAGRAAIQRQLSRLGRQPGPADGVFGPRTRLAIAAWQRANGLTATGHLTGPQVRMIAAQAEGSATDTAAQDRAFWQQSGAAGEAEGLRAYLDRYPQGIHAEAARRQLAKAGAGRDTPQGDEATWRWARRQGSAAAYETYLERFPAGTHAPAARDRLATLRAGIEAARREEAGLGLAPSTRRLIEERLRIAGMQPGPADGEFTEETRAALRRYQAARNLRVTGYVTRQTVSGLLADVLR